MEFKYHMQVNMGKDETGQTKYQYAVGETEEQFFASVGRLWAEREGYKPPEKTLKPEISVPTFDEYAEKWLSVYVVTKRPNTQNVYRSQLKHWQNAFQGKLISAIRPTDVQQVLMLHKGKKKKYLTDVLNILQQVLELALEDGYVTRNVARSKTIVIPGEASKERRILTDEELAHCINKLSEIEARDDKLCAAIHIFTGMRPGEVLGLEWGDIDFENKKINIQRAVASHGSKGVIGGTKTKNGKRKIELLPQLAEILKPRRGVGPIFTCDGAPYGQYQREQMAARIEKVMDIGHLVPYNFRHTFATKAYESGSKVKSLSRWMGHSDESVTLKFYVHNTDKMCNETGEIVHTEFEKLAANYKK